MNLIDNLRRLGFQGSDKEALETLHYIGLATRGLSTNMTIEGLKQRVARDLNLADSDLDGQLGSRTIEFVPEMTAALVGLALLNEGKPLAEVLMDLKTAALQSLAEEEIF